MRRSILIFVLLAAAISQFSCAKWRRTKAAPANSETYYAVTAKSAKFFRYGPQQGSGPDRRLPRNTLMTLSSRSFGYAKVRLTTGEDGYVAGEDIGIAPPALIAAAFPTPTPAPISYPEPKLPTLELAPAVEPTAIPSSSPRSH